MTNRFPLPSECLALILRHLATFITFPTLAILLRTNKYLCLATLPFLYTDPFDLIVPRFPLQINGMSRHFDIGVFYPRLHALIRTLLTSVPHKSCADLI
jgi:hypothetical protein